MENDITFMLKEKEIKKDKFKKLVFISTIIIISIVLTLNLVSFLIS